jgi:hypothetical protein
MGPERHGGAMTEPATEIDRALQAALAVEPSPEFVVGIRRRVANEHPPAAPGWRWPWLLSAAGAAAAAIAIIVVVSRPHETASVTPIAQALQPARAGQPLGVRPGPLVAARPDPVEGRVHPREPALVRRANGPAPQPIAPEPEVLIDPREAMALRQLITGTRDGSLDLSAALRATSPTAMELPELSDVVIVPITIEPLEPAAGAEGVRP